MATSSTEAPVPGCVLGCHPCEPDRQLTWSPAWSWWSQSATAPFSHQRENFSTDLPCLFLTELRVLPLLTHALSYDSLLLPGALAQAAEGADWGAPHTHTHSVASTSSTPTQVPIQASPIRMSSSPEGSSARSLHGSRNLRVWVLPPGIGSDTPSFSFLCTLSTLGHYENRSSSCLFVQAFILGVNPDAYTC